MALKIARGRITGEPIPEAPRTIVDAVGSYNKLPFRLRARGEFEFVKAKPLGDGFTGVPVTEIRGAVLRPFLDDRMSIAANFLIAHGYTGQTVVLQVSNADRIAAERPSCVFSLPIEKAVDELNLPKKIISCHPSNLPLSDHVDRFVALNRSPRRLEFSEALFRVHSTFDGSMILFENVVQVLHRSVSTTVAQRSFLLTVGDRGAVDRRHVSVDHSRLRMGPIAERLAKQPLGSIGVPER